MNQINLGFSSIEIAKLPNFTDDFARNIKFLTGRHHMSYYLGNGKDGKVYKMHNPRDHFSAKYDDIAIKVWEPTFKLAVNEIDLHALAQAGDSSYFRVPQLIHVDYQLNAFAMERIKGKTALQAIFKEKRRITADFLQTILSAFRSLNAMGICHSDSHTENYMFSDMEIELVDDQEVIVDAQLWIIDFGRSRIRSYCGSDIEKVQFDLDSKVIR